jgi:hypothetical protein
MKELFASFTMFLLHKKFMPPAGEALLLELLSQRSGGGALGITAEARDQIAAGLRQEAQEALQMLAQDLAEIDAAINTAAADAAPAATTAVGSQRNSLQQRDDSNPQDRRRSSSSSTGFEAAEDAQLLAELLQQRRQLQEQQQLLQQLLSADVPRSTGSRPAAGDRASSRGGFRPSPMARQQQIGTTRSSNSSEVGQRVFYGVPECFQCQPLHVCVSAGDAAVMLWALGMRGLQVSSP